MCLLAVLPPQLAYVPVGPRRRRVPDGILCDYFLRPFRLLSDPGPLLFGTPPPRLPGARPVPAAFVPRPETELPTPTRTTRCPTGDGAAPFYGERPRSCGAAYAPSPSSYHNDDDDDDDDDGDRHDQDDDDEEEEEEEAGIFFSAGRSGCHHGDGDEIQGRS